MAAEFEDVLILCKTYPSPSKKHVELSCVAGITKTGQLVRLFPVPFRLMRDEEKFGKWQWIRARIEPSKDSRPESHYIKIDTLTCGMRLDTKNNWQLRREQLDKIEIYESLEHLEAVRTSTGVSLGLIKPHALIDMEIKESSPEWTKEDIEKLTKAEKQASLFDDNNKKPIKILEKLPFDFYYIFTSIIDGVEKQFRTKAIDWEVGAAYLNFKKLYGDQWKEKFKEKYVTQFQKKDLSFLIGNHNRFRHQWMIISIIYPPREKPSPVTADLFSGF